jgi:HAD superfamily hydrolase (TIGR01484 family)
MKKQYKALLLDVDGTLVENNNFDAIPTERVRDAIKKAQQKLHVGIVTSRPLFLCKNILDHLQLSGPCVVQGGAQIIDGKSHKILREHRLPKKHIMKAYEIARKYDIELHADHDVEHVVINSAFPLEERDFFGFVTIPAIPLKTARAFFEEVRKIPELAVYTSSSKDDENMEFVFGTHASVTKQHGILEVAELLGISTHEIIGVGDGYNDFPMMMACGLKIAMANAVPELKEIADYIAPSVDEDGVADVIEKFIL